MNATTLPTDTSVVGAGSRLRRRLYSRSAGVTVGTGVLAVMIVIGIVALFWTPYDPMQTATGPLYAPPSWSHLFGTDDLGSDVFSRTLAATTTDVGVTVAAVLIAFLIGAALGAVSGFYGGWLDAVVMRLLEMLQAFPSLLLAMLMVAAVGSGIANVVIVVAIIGIPNYIRLMRAEVLSRKNWQFAEAAALAGNRPLGVLFRHLVPNSMTPLYAFAPINASWVAVTVASLGFIGLGIEPGSAEWGSMISRGQTAIISGEWWIAFFPGLAIVLLAGAFYLIGDGLTAANSVSRDERGRRR